MKIAFIGDSFSAYEQEGQFKQHWTYLLDQQSYNIHITKYKYFQEVMITIG